MRLEFCQNTELGLTAKLKYKTLIEQLKWFSKTWQDSKKKLEEQELTQVIGFYNYKFKLFGNYIGLRKF